MSRLEIAPDTCPNCKGEGQLEAEYRGSGIVCSACGGRGHVWPDKLIERGGQAIATWWGHEVVSKDDRLKAQLVLEAMLDVLWEVGNDN